MKKSNASSVSAFARGFDDGFNSAFGVLTNSYSTSLKTYLPSVPRSTLVLKKKEIARVRAEKAKK